MALNGFIVHLFDGNDLLEPFSYLLTFANRGLAFGIPSFKGGERRVWGIARFSLRWKISAVWGIS